MLESRLALWARQSRWARPIGIAAFRTWDKLRPSEPGPKVLVNAVPKSGTHLLMGLFDQVPGYRFAGHLLWATEMDALADDCVGAAAHIEEMFARTSSRHYLIGHVMHHPRVSAALAESGVPVITAIRDPRAVTASAVRYWEENKLRKRDLSSHTFASREELAQWVIDGEGDPGTANSMPPVAERVRQYVGWLDDPNCLVVKFEDLVGEQGDGSADEQIATIDKILVFCGLGDLVDAETLARGTYRQQSHTFSVGKVRSWDSVLTPKQVAQVEEQAADVMKAFGYG